MRELVLLSIHLLATLAKFPRPGGVRAVVAESLALKHQLLICNRSRQRSPNLTGLDRLLLALTSMFMRPHRIPKLSVIIKPATLLRFHKTLVNGKYRRLLIAHSKDSLWSVDLFRCESILLHSFWVMVVLDVFTRRIIGFGIERGEVDGVAVCRMFNQAIAGQPLPKHISTDHDPLFRFHRWLANLRVLDIDEIKSVPNVPVSHPFVERLIGTVRRELLDHSFFWNGLDLGRKLEAFTLYYNGSRVHQSLDGSTPEEQSGRARPACAALDSYRWQQHCRGLFQTPIAV